MKFTVKVPGSCRAAFFRQGRGFTLPELLIAITVFGFLIMGVIAGHLYGLSMFRVTETKITATDDARRTLGRIAKEVQASKSVSVGNVTTNGLFEGLLDGETQKGSALCINPSTNTAIQIFYFMNQKDSTFRRTTTMVTNAVILSDTITNFLIFTAQDYKGKPLTNNLNTRVIHIDLEFYQPKRYRQVADYFKVETSVTRRTLE